MCLAGWHRRHSGLDLSNRAIFTRRVGKLKVCFGKSTGGWDIVKRSACSMPTLSRWCLSISTLIPSIFTPPDTTWGR